MCNHDYIDKDTTLKLNKKESNSRVRVYKCTVCKGEFEFILVGNQWIEN